jgi:hypothetical protein
LLPREVGAAFYSSWSLAETSCDAPIDSAERLDQHYLSFLLRVVPFGEGTFPLFIKTSFEI